MWLYAALGPERLADFLKRFGGRRFWIPGPSTVLPCAVCPRRSHHMRRLRGEGVSTAELARIFGLSVAHAHSLLKPRVPASEPCPK